MQCKILFFVAITLITLKSACSQTTATEWPYNAKLTFPFLTNAPININTSSVRLLVAPPLEFTNALFEVSNVVNTGRTIEAYIAKGNTSCSITGGPLFNNKYRFYKVRFYWNNKKGRSATAIDGRGEPLEVVVIYYKEEYGCFENALNHRDGLAITSTRITLRTQPNFFFGPTQCTLNKLQKPGCSDKILSSIFHSWFNLISQSQFYYTYPGSYIDLQTGKRYMSSIELVFEPVVGYISHEQFAAFQNLKNVFGAPLENVSPLFPPGCRPVLKGTGTCLVKLTLG